MSYEDCLPFGKTDITAEEYREQIDYDKAARLLRENGVENPEEKLDTFIEKVPELLEWLEQNGREYPWRYTTDPWKVYVAEILLQRTRGSSVEKVYPEFVEEFDSPEKVHQASADEISEVINPLGLTNRRLKTLQSVGEVFYKENSGEFKLDEELMSKPWRVGKYVVNATYLFSGICFRPLVDPNILKLLKESFRLSASNISHKQDSSWELMAEITPNELKIARAFYFSIIDY